MWKSVKSLLQVSGTKGLLVPHAYDPVKRQPSIRLLMAATSFVLAMGSIVALHWFAGLLTATWTAISFFAFCIILTMFREVDSFKFDAEQRSVEISNDSSNDGSAS